MFAGDVAIESEGIFKRYNSILVHRLVTHFAKYPYLPNWKRKKPQTSPKQQPCEQHIVKTWLFVTIHSLTISSGGKKWKRRDIVCYLLLQVTQIFVPQ